MTENTRDLALPFGVVLPEVNNLILEFNRHMSSYMTIEEYFERCLDDRKDWVSEDERAKAIANNTVWQAHWYNASPVGSYSVLASTLEAALLELKRIAEEESK